MKTYYIVKGSVTDPEAWSEAEGREVIHGEVEWQFSDGLPGERGSSADFLSLEEGIKWCSPAIFVWVG